MRVAVLLAVLFATAISARAQEVPSLSEIAESLQQSPIYVGEGFPGVDDAVISRLDRQLYDDDQILLVLLPRVEYEAFTADDLARDLSELLGDQHIVGLALGDEVVVHAPVLPTGVGTDLMDRATSLANNNPVTALSTFVQNVHKWQADNPMPTPPPPPVEQTEENGEEGSSVAWYALGLGLAGAFVAAILWIRIMRGRGFSVGAQAVRGQIGSTLNAIQQQRNQVHDYELRQIIDGLVQDVHRFLSDKSRHLSELENLGDRLEDVEEILVQYLDIQDNRIYHRRADERMQTGKEAIRAFKDSVLEKILQGSDQQLLSFRLNTNILLAEKEVLDI